jgi:eukaryotic-like serine/threonine-protein kinase
MSHVAVKLPRSDLMDDLPTARRLGQEARTLRRLAHPAIQRLLEDGHWQPVPHLVLEHIEGPTLTRLRDEGGPMGLQDLVRTGAQLAACLHYLHGRGLVHLDLRPDTVVLRDGRAILIDLGAARPSGTPRAPKRPDAGHPGVAPEQRSRAPVDPAMDIYALGALLYELAIGEPPRPADDDASPPRQAGARTLRPSLPAGAERAIHAMLQPDPGHRPASALDALRLLVAALPDADAAVWPGVVQDVPEGERNAVGY